MNHRRLLRFALLMWAGPLAAGAFVLSGFLFLRAQVFVAAGLTLLVAGGLCLSAGVIAVILILATRNSAPEMPRRYYKKPSLVVLGLLLLNLPVALAFALIGSTAMERSAVAARRSPHGDLLAEVIYLDEREAPPYGQAVTLRPATGLFSHQPRTVVFSGHCIGLPTFEWRADDRLAITCAGATQVERRLSRFRDTEISYQFPAAATRAPRAKSRN